jgi:hypothetical protein
MEFRPPCMVSSTIGISKPGKLEGKSTQQCSTHLHQLHVCLPSSRNKTRLLYRMSLDFAPWLKHIPYMHLLWSHFAEKASLSLVFLTQFVPIASNDYIFRHYLSSIQAINMITTLRIHLESFSTIVLLQL